MSTHVTAHDLQAGDAVVLTFDGAIATITLNRPQKKNALTIEDMTTIGTAINEAVVREARAICITGAGGSFSAGRDLSGVDPATDDTLAVLRDQITPVLNAVRRCPVPTLARVEGPALGFGFGLALACDMVYAAETALMGSPFRNIGLVMDSGGHYYLRERLGRALAAELIFTGRLFSGLDAARMGLINRAVAVPALGKTCDELLARLASGPTRAFTATKRILDEAADYEAVCEMEARAQAALMASDDAREGLSAFQEKRKPRFTGR